MTLNLEQFHGTFFDESFEALDAMEAALLRLEIGVADPELINTIFRVAHSIKGGAGMFGFDAIASFTHTLETLLDELRAGRMRVTAPISEGLLQSVDVLRAMMTATRKGQPVDAEAPGALQAQFVSIIEAGDSSADDPEDLEALFDSIVAKVQAKAASKAVAASRWRIGLRALPELLNRGNDPVRMFEDLAALGNLAVTADLSRLPSFHELDPTQCHLAWDLELETPASRAAIEEVFDWAQGDCELTIEPVQPAETVCAEPEPQRPAKPEPVSAASPTATVPSLASAEGNSIRVSIDKIDELLNSVGEIVITQSMLRQLAGRFEGLDADRLRSGLGQLEANIRALQESVMRVRMLPVGSVFSRFPRVVRDLASRLGKQIRLDLDGEATELDKTVLEKIGDPLVHLIRNSIDHGIETPEERVAAGKPAEGVITMNAAHRSGSITLEVGDDGRGLDHARLRQKAIEKGLIDPQAVLTDEQVNELIFLPGFSTAEQTTDLSGRGVGMDVVRRNIKDLGGSIELRSEPGQGTRFSITLPLTLAIVDGQSVAVGAETYIVPLVAIIESLQIRAGGATHLVRHGEVFSFRGEYLPIIRLHEMFGVEPKYTALHDGLLMVVEGEGRRAGLFIDDLLGQQQVVIKSMETHYTRIDGIGGATILGEGTVALILDVPGLIRLAAERRAKAVA